MRHFEKGSEPKSLEIYRESMGAFKNLPIATKTEIRSLGFKEQGGLCALCCGYLPDREPARIAHLEPQSSSPAQALIYENMVLSCAGGDGLDVTTRPRSFSCDRKQKASRLPVTPLQPDCEIRFNYTSNGAIIPASDDDKETDETINILALNCERLRQARVAAYEEAVENLEALGDSEFRSRFLDPKMPILSAFLPMLEQLLA